MFDTRRRLSALEAQVHDLDGVVRDQLKQLDVVELERMRSSVLNALRALRRTQEADETRKANGEGSGEGDHIGRVLATRRGAHGLL